MWERAKARLQKVQGEVEPAPTSDDPTTNRPGWQPAVDVYSSERTVDIIAALPGVDVADVDVLLLESELVLGGTRAFPSDLYDHGFQRMEIPLGPFERRVALPPGDYRIVRREAWRGCLLLRLERLQVSPEADPAEG